MWSRDRPPDHDMGSWQNPRLTPHQPRLQELLSQRLPFGGDSDPSSNTQKGQRELSESHGSNWWHHQNQLVRADVGCIQVVVHEPRT